VVKGELACLYKGSLEGTFKNVCYRDEFDGCGRSHGGKKLWRLWITMVTSTFLNLGNCFHPALRIIDAKRGCITIGVGERFADVTFRGGFGMCKKRACLFVLCDLSVGKGENDVFIELCGGVPLECGFTNAYFFLTLDFWKPVRLHQVALVEKSKSRRDLVAKIQRLIFQQMVRIKRSIVGSNKRRQLWLPILDRSFRCRPKHE